MLAFQQLHVQTSGQTSKWFWHKAASLPHSMVNCKHQVAPMCTISNRWFPGPTPISTTRCISIGSAVSAQLTTQESLYVTLGCHCSLVKLLTVNLRCKFTKCCNLQWILRHRRSSAWLTWFVTVGGRLAAAAAQAVYAEGRWRSVMCHFSLSKLSFCMGICFLGPPEFTPQTASWSI